MIPHLSICVTPMDGANALGVARARRVDVLCEHCDSAYELYQKREDDAWATKAAHQADARARERIAHALAGQHSAVTYVDRPAVDLDDLGRQDLIDDLDRYIASTERVLAEAQQRRAELMGARPAEAAALGVGKPAANQFPYTSGDMRHLMRPHDADEQSASDIWAHG